MGIQKRLIAAGIFLLLSLIITDFFVSRLTKRQSQLEQTFKSIQKAASNLGGSSEPTPTPAPPAIPYAGYPKSYKNSEIPVEIYKQASLRYHVENKTEVKNYVINLIHKYYIYKDFLSTEKIPFTAQFPVTFSTIEADVPVMESLVQQNMVTYVDFAFIKARFRYTPEEERLQRIYGDLKAKARSKLDEYRQKFSGENIDAAAIVNEANHDIDLISLNNNEGNRIETHYTPDKELFFTDKKFNTFLFAQKQGVVSNIFTLHGATNDEYAYVIVYPTMIQRKQYTTSDELVMNNLQNFKYY